jgi:DNA polymerase III delta subunit
VDCDFQSNNRSICPFILGNDSETRTMVSKSNLILKSLVTSNKLIQVVLRNSKKKDERILSYLCSNLEIDIYDVCPESLKLSLYKSESILNLIGKETLINKVNKFNADNFITEYCDNKELVNLINLTTDCSLNKVELIIS